MREAKERDRITRMYANTPIKRATTRQQRRRTAILIFKSKRKDEKLHSRNPVFVGGGIGGQRTNGATK